MPTYLNIWPAQVMLFIFGKSGGIITKNHLIIKGFSVWRTTWRLYTVGLFLFLQNAVERFVDSYSFLKLYY